MFRADLHCHSTCSDGTLTPQEILHKAQELGLSGLSITDHDTTMAYPEVIDDAKDLGIEMIPGVEFSTMYGGESIHVLAYSFPIDHIAIQGLCKMHRERREQRAELIVHKLKKNGVYLDFHDLKRHRTIVRPHIAKEMIKKGYVDSIEEAFKKYLGKNGACFVPSETISTEQTIEIIHSCGGIAILAHPHLIRNKKVVKGLLELPFDGIEAYYARFPKSECEKWLKIAKERNMLISGGSDFHGAIKPESQLGSSWVDEEGFRSLQTNFEVC